MGPRVGIGDRHHDQEVGDRAVGGEPLVAVDHPLVAVADGGGLQQRRIRAGGVGLGHAERRLQVPGQQRMQVALLLLLAAGQREDLRVAGVGRRVAERQRRDRAGAEDLVHQPELDLAEPLAAELGIEVRRPQAALADLLGERRDRALEPVVAELVDQRLQRPDALAHELAHPVELLLKLGLCGEIPGHRGSAPEPSAGRRYTVGTLLQTAFREGRREVGLPFAHGSRSGGPYAAAASGSPHVRSTLPSCTRKARARTCTSAAY